MDIENLKNENFLKSTEGTLILKENPGINPNGRYSATYTREELKKMMEKYSLTLTSRAKKG